MTNITLDYLIANNSRLLPHIEERAVRVSHHQTVMLQNSLQLPIMSGWAERATSAYTGIDLATELSENTDIPKANLYRNRLAASKPKEWGLAYELTDRRISSDPENILADVISALGIGLRRRIEELFFKAADSFTNKLSESTNFALRPPTIATLLGLATQANHISPGVGDLLFVAHPYQVYQMYEELVAIGSAVTNKPIQGEAALSNLQQLPNLNNVALAIPNIGLITLSHNMPRRLQLKIRVHGANGNFRLQVGSGNNIVPTSSPSSTTVYNITTTIAVAGMNAARIKAALDALNQGTWTVTGTNTGTGFTIVYPTDLFLPDYYQLRVATDTSAPDNISLESNAPIGYIQKSAYDNVGGTDPYSDTPVDINGNNLGISLDETGATARMLAYRRNALAFDARTAPKLTADLLKDERVIRYAYYQTFNATGWDVRNGFTYMANAAAFI